MMMPLLIPVTHHYRWFLSAQVAVVHLSFTHFYHAHMCRTLFEGHTTVYSADTDSLWCHLSAACSGFWKRDIYLMVCLCKGRLELRPKHAHGCKSFSNWICVLQHLLHDIQLKINLWLSTVDSHHWNKLKYQRSINTNVCNIQDEFYSSLSVNAATVNAATVPAAMS